MAGKPEILRALDGLQDDSLKEVKAFIDSLKKTKDKRVKKGSPPLPSRQSMAREIVVRMAPLSSRDVKVRAETVRPAKPRVVFDPVLGDY